MYQPVFKPTSITPPAANRPGYSYQPPFIAPTFTPQHPNHQILTPPQHFHTNRPPSYQPSRNPQTQSYIFPTQSRPVDQNRPLLLDSFARKASFQEQNVLSQNQTIQSIRVNQSIQRSDSRQFANNSIQMPQRIKKPLFASQIFTQQSPVDQCQTKKGDSFCQRSSLPFQTRQISDMQQNLSDLKLKFAVMDENSKRQYKTDRDVPNYPIQNTVVPMGINIKYRQNNNLQYPKETVVAKTQTISMNSTQNSLNSSNNNEPKAIPNFITTLKKNASSNFWPLSISPSEQKRQCFMPGDVINSQKNEAVKKVQGSLQFRKKKPTEMGNSIKPVYEYPKKDFVLDDFQLLDKIGKGAFGDVFVAQQKLTGFVCVIKKLLKKKLIQLKLQQHLLRQIKIQSFLKHRHLTSLYGFFNDQSNIYLILQIMPDGSMMQVKKRKKIPEADVARYLKQICEGLKYMHTQQIIHRDIKPQNIFLNDGYAKIGDFGCSIFTHSLRNTVVGSLAYISPEQLKQGFYDEKIDVWSIGVMTYQMLVGKSPYEEDIIKIARQQIAPNLSEIKLPSSIDLSSQAKDFILQTLNIDPNQRIGIVEALQHDFLKKFDKKQERVICNKQSL